MNEFRESLKCHDWVLIEHLNYYDRPDMFTGNSIQVRAVRRMGELLEAIESAQGMRTDQLKTVGSAIVVVTNRI